MGYFNLTLPLAVYRNQIVPNILTRIKLANDTFNATEIYHPFIIPEGDRPDTIAELYYDDPELDWMIYLANNITNIKDEWPLDSDTFEKVMVSTYPTNLHSVKNYYIDISIPDISQNQYNNLQTDSKKYWLWNYNLNVYSINNKIVEITPDTFNSMNVKEKVYWKPLTNYDYEFDKNEKKRVIRLIDKRYKDQVIEQIKNI